MALLTDMGITRRDLDVVSVAEVGNGSVVVRVVLQACDGVRGFVGHDGTGRGEDGEEYGLEEFHGVDDVCRGSNMEEKERIGLFDAAEFQLRKNNNTRTSARFVIGVLSILYLAVGNGWVRQRGWVSE